MLEPRFSLVVVGGDAGCTDLPAQIASQSDIERPDRIATGKVSENSAEGERNASDWQWQQIYKWFRRGRNSA
jgi:hypothetical protein